MLHYSASGASAKRSRILRRGKPQDPSGDASGARLGRTAVPQSPLETLRERREAPRRGLPHRTGSS
ncbi:hypothetical protein [Nostoc sp.]